MSLNEQIQPTAPAEPDPAPAAGQTRTSGVDDILHELDAVPQTDAAAFVQGFVQKGGQ